MSISIVQRLKQLEQARQAREAQRIAAFGRLLTHLAPEEATALEMALEANLVNQIVPPEIERQADVAFAKMWAAAAPQERALLSNRTDARSW